jgi:hypothetical protein
MQEVKMQKKSINEVTLPSGAGRIIPVRLVRRPMTRKRWIVTLIILVVLLAAIAGTFWYRMANSASGYIDTGTYQAVFVANNQAYFGKLQHLADGSYRLTNVYYLQQSNNVSQKADSSDQTPQLVKMGSELHGPSDQIVFDAHQVLFWENLRSDSKVVQAINNYLKK